MIVIPVICLLAFRFIARGMDNMDLYLLAGLGSALMLGIRFYLFRSNRR